MGRQAGVSIGGKQNRTDGGGKYLTSIEQLPPEYQSIIRKYQERKDYRAMPAKSAAEKAGVGVSSLWRAVKMRHFVPPIRLSERRVAWLEAEVDALLEAKKLISRSGQTIDLRLFVDALVSASHEPRS